MEINLTQKILNADLLPVAMYRAGATSRGRGIDPDRFQFQRSDGQKTLNLIQVHMKAVDLQQSMTDKEYYLSFCLTVSR